MTATQPIPEPAVLTAAEAATQDEIVSARGFSQPPDALFAAFADPATLARWWGPAGFRNTIRQFDFREGGTWRYTMHGPDGTDYENESVFHEVSANYRIILEHLAPHHHFVMTQLFLKEGSGTRLVWRMKFDTAEEVSKLREFILQANQQNFDRLEACLAGPAVGPVLLAGSIG